MVDMPRVRVPLVLCRYSGGARDVDVGGTTVRAALEALFALHPALRSRVLDDAARLRPYLRLYRGSAPAGLDDALGAGDTLEIVGAAEGG